MRPKHFGPLVVTAHLATQLAGDPPRLDALMEWAMSLHCGVGEQGHKVDRALPAPEQGVIPIPMARDWLGEWLVGRCSDPILPEPELETVEYVHKKIGVEHAELLAPASRHVVSTTNTHLKSYRLPLRIRRVPCVRWFMVGMRRNALKLLKQVRAVGKKPSDGYGRVSAWEVESAEQDMSWFAPTEHGALLMRRLPVGPWLPSDVIGSRRSYGAAACPYWHPERYTEIIEPC